VDSAFDGFVHGRALAGSCGWRKNNEGGGHNNFHRGILKVPVKLLFGEIFLVDSWNRCLCLGTHVDLGPFFQVGMGCERLFLDILAVEDPCFLPGFRSGIDISMRVLAVSKAFQGGILGDRMSLF